MTGSAPGGDQHEFNCANSLVVMLSQVRLHTHPCVLTCVLHGFSCNLEPQIINHLYQFMRHVMLYYISFVSLMIAAQIIS